MSYNLLKPWILTFNYYKGFKMEFSQVHISKGSGKLELINSISTNTLTNDYCSKQAKNKKSICSLCYSQKSLKTFRKNMVNVLDRNSRLF